MADHDGDPDALDKQLSKLVDRFRVTSGKHFKLRDFPTRCEIARMGDKDSARAALEAGTKRLSKLQEQLYAHGTWSVLIVLQAMDAGGKDGTIKHVMSGVNPQGVTVTSFKPPGVEELAHNFLWRVSKALPARGMIGIFNRSHYEEVLAARVEPGILGKQRLPPEVTQGNHFWEHRLEDIAAFERHLARQGTRILKFFLNISPDEQRKRFLARLDDPAKLWKFSPGDLDDRAKWDAYMDAYETAIAATAKEDAPWFMIPADDKPIARVLVVSALLQMLEELDLRPRPPGPELETSLAEARRRLSG